MGVTVRPLRPDELGLYLDSPEAIEGWVPRITDQSLDILLRTMCAYADQADS